MSTTHPAKRGRRARVACGVSAVAVAGLMFAGVYAAVPGQQAQADSAPAEDAAAEADPYAPEVRVLDDGRLVQLTPNSSDDYSTRTLQADTRGCSSCHPDLEATLQGMLPETHHLLLQSGVDTDLGLEQCLTCHHEGQYQESLGTLLHPMHRGVADCFDCHDANALDNEMTLWDMVKYDRLEGISSVANVEGDFTWTQDEVIPTDELFDTGWTSDDYQLLGYQDALGEDVPTDPELFDTWTISVTGIPVSWLLEQAGLTDESRAILFATPTSANPSFSHSLNLDEFSSRDAHIVYEINGERLSWKAGYPAQVWIPED